MSAPGRPDPPRLFPARSGDASSGSRRVAPPASSGGVVAASSPPGRSTASWRVVVLAVVVVLALAVVLPTLRAYGRQNDRLAELRAQVAAAEAEVADLEAELARWEDPRYVEAQARERLFYVFPGETAFRVIDPEVVGDDSEAPDSGAEIPVREAVPWYVGLWETFASPEPEPSGGAP